MINIKCIKKDNLTLPQYQTEGSAGADVYAYIQDDIILKPGQRIAVPTGLEVEIPNGYEIQIRPRSGLALKYGITCLNTPGTIDSDFRGEIKVILINLGEENFTIKNSDRIAQMIVSPVVKGNFVFSSSISDSERGCGGFGSTGK